MTNKSATRYIGVRGILWLRFRIERMTPINGSKWYEQPLPNFVLRASRTVVVLHQLRRRARLQEFYNNQEQCCPRDRTYFSLLTPRQGSTRFFAGYSPSAIDERDGRSKLCISTDVAFSVFSLLMAGALGELLIPPTLVESGMPPQLLSTTKKGPHALVLAAGI